MAEPIEWRVLHPRSPRARWALAAFAGLVFGGGASLAAVAAVSTGGQSGFTVAGLLLVGTVGATAGLGWWRSARERTPMADAVAIDAAGLRWLPVAGAVAAAHVLGVGLVGEATVVRTALLAVVLGAAGFLLVQALRGTGRYDPETGVATVDGRVYDLGLATTAVPVAGLTIVVVRRPSPDLQGRYGVLAMPTDVYGEVVHSTPGDDMAWP